MTLILWTPDHEPVCHEATIVARRSGREIFLYCERDRVPVCNIVLSPRELAAVIEQALRQEE